MPASQPVPPPFGCWCAAGSLRRVFRTKRFGLVRCTGCGCFRIDPPPVASEEEGSRFYTDYYANGELPGGEGEREAQPEVASRDSRFWRVVDFVPELAHPRESVADIGCGEGGLCSELKAAGWKSVVGFDLSTTRIERARKKHAGIDFRDCAFTSGQMPEASLDMVTMDNVVEHMPDPVSVLLAVARSLKSGGKVVLITPNMRSGQFRLLGRRWTPELSPHAHVFLFTPAALERLLVMSGFIVERIGTYQFGRYPLSAMSREWRRGEYKEAVWHAVQEAGSVYARLIDSGPMVWAVARPARSPSGGRSKG